MKIFSTPMSSHFMAVLLFLTIKVFVFPFVALVNYSNGMCSQIFTSAYFGTRGDVNDSNFIFRWRRICVSMNEFIENKIQIFMNYFKKV